MWAKHLVSAVALVVFAACGGAPSAKSPALGQQISAQLADEDGAMVPLATTGGAATVIAFWAPGCEECKPLVETLVARRAELGNRGARLVLVGVLAEDESTTDGKKTLDLWGIKEPFLLDRGANALKQVGAVKVPAAAVLDRAGVLKWLSPPGAGAGDAIDAIP